MIGNTIAGLFVNPQDPSEDEEQDFNVAGNEILATFSPWASWLSKGDLFAPAPTMGFPTVADGSTNGQATPDSVIAVSSGGITINLIFDTAAMAAPASFRAGIQQAVAILAAAISDKITVNLKIDYSGTGGGAAAGPDHGLFQSYSSIRADLINNATPGDTTFNALTAGSTIQGQSNVAVWNAQLKLWGLMGANDTTTDDGGATFATDINPNLLVGVALHELTHAMGRVPYGTQPDIFDFFRFTNAGTRLFQGGATAPAAYFSLDGGTTKLADYGRASDASDFLNSGVQGSNDPFNEFYNGSTAQHLTAVDLKQLDALGFHLMVPDTTAPALVHDGSVTLAVGATATILSSQLQFDDNVSSHAQEAYTVVTGPTHGTLLKSGAATSSFTQADIDNGLIAYHENGTVASSDSFIFKVTDAAGNATSMASFQFNISYYPAFAQPTAELSAFAPGAGGWTDQDHYPRELADVNGDHMADIVGFGADGVIVSLASGNGHFGALTSGIGNFGSSAAGGGWTSDNQYPREVADVNGDHMADIVGFGADGVIVSLATGNGHFASPVAGIQNFGFLAASGGWTSENQYPRQLADVNGDGMADIVGFGADGVIVSLATGNGHFASPVAGIQNFGFLANGGGWTSQDQYPRLLADVNGDHMADIVGFGADGAIVSLATGNGHFASPVVGIQNFGFLAGGGGWTSENQYPRELADVNGDGMADIVGFGADGAIVSFATGNGHFASPVAGIGSFGVAAGGWIDQNQYPRELADVSGDGAADIIGFGQNGVYEALSNGFHLV